MNDFDKPDWKWVFLVGLVIFMAFVVIVLYDAIAVSMDEDDFCEGLSGYQDYPLCERNTHKMCHGKSDLTVPIDCGDDAYEGEAE